MRELRRVEVQDRGGTFCVLLHEANTDRVEAYDGLDFWLASDLAMSWLQTVDPSATRLD